MSRELLIAILSEWLIAHTPGNYELTDSETKYSVPDFFAVTDALFKLKGITGEEIAIRPEDVGEKP